MHLLHSGVVEPAIVHSQQMGEKRINSGGNECSQVSANAAQSFGTPAIDTNVYRDRYVRMS